MADQLGVFLAANYCATTDQFGASLAADLDREAFRVARRASTRAEPHVAGCRQIVFHYAKAIHRAADCCFPCRVRLRVQVEPGLSLLVPLT
ncbi:MAG: hypothetical protein ACREA2_06480, partial [Blastocatellia bacterium]